MFIKEIEVRNFRNLKEQVVFFSNKFSILTGKNGQGKTSLLEAVYLLSNHKSFRTYWTDELVNYTNKTEPSYINAMIQTEDGQKSLALNIKDGKKSYTLNGNKISKISEIYDQIISVVFTPEDLQIIKASPQLRRNYIDRTISIADKVYLNSLMQYYQALKNKNSLLSSPATITAQELSPWNSILAENGFILLEKRKKFISEIEKDFIKYYSLISNTTNKTEKVKLIYKPQFDFSSREEYFEKLQSNSIKDIKYKSTSLGIHRDDLEIFISSAFSPDDFKLAKELASQGQTRSLALALKISSLDYLHRITSRAPLLLLDDVESELDSMRRSGLISLLEEFNTQVIVTTTDISMAEKTFGSKAEFFYIEDGEIVKNSFSSFRRSGSD